MDSDLGRGKQKVLSWCGTWGLRSLLKDLDQGWDKHSPRDFKFALHYPPPQDRGGNSRPG